MAKPSDRLADDIEAELALLGEFSLHEIRTHYTSLKQQALPKHMRSGLARLALGQVMQEQAFGGLDRASRRKLETLVATIVPKGGAKPKPRNKALRPGTRLVRQWKGRMYEVAVTREGFEWDGKSWRSLTEVARTITGTNWNGWVFFGLKARQTKSAEIATAPAELSDA